MKIRLLAAVVLFLSSSVTGADAPREIRHKSQDLERIREEMSRKKSERERLEREADELAERVRREEKRMRNVEKSLLNTRQRRVEVEQQVAVAKIRHDSLAAELAENQTAFNSAAERYFVAMLLQGPHGLAPVYGRQAIRLRGTAVRETKEQAVRQNENLDELVAASTILRTETQKQQNRLSGIRGVRRDTEKKLSKTKTRQELIDDELRELRQSAEQLESMIDNLRSRAKVEAADEKRARAAKQKSGSSPVLARSLPWPVKGKVSMRFGRQHNAAIGAPVISNGIVIDTPERGPVVSVGTGKVLYAGRFMSYGGTVVVEHPGDWFAVYGRLSEWNVEKGQEVKQGDLIGKSRSRPTGGAEAYFELRFYGKPTDPMPWLKAP